MCLSICRFLSSIVQVNFPDTQASTRSLQCRWSRPGEHGWINHRNPLRTLNRTKNKTKPDPEGCISGCILDWLYLITVLFGSRFAVDMPLWVPTEHYWLFQNAVKSQVFLVIDNFSYYNSYCYQPAILCRFRNYTNEYKCPVRHFIHEREGISHLWSMFTHYLI